MLASSLRAPLVYTPLGVDIVRVVQAEQFAYCEAAGNGRRFRRRVVGRIIVNLFHQKNGGREGGSVRKEVNSEAAKGDVEIMPV